MVSLAYPTAAPRIPVPPSRAPCPPSRAPYLAFRAFALAPHLRSRSGLLLSRGQEAWDVTFVLYHPIRTP